MKNEKLKGVTGRFYLMSQIQDPTTWTRKRNFDVHQANLKLLAEAIKNSCYKKAGPDQAVFYTKDTVQLIGEKIVSIREVTDGDITYHLNADGNGVEAEENGKTWGGGFDSWRQVREKKVVVEPEVALVN